MTTRGPLVAVVVAALASGCGRAAETWPEPPAVDEAQYRKDHDAWLAEERQGLSQVLPIVGIWTLPQGDTPFGSDPRLPITLPPQYFPAHAGVVRRSGGDFTIIPTPGAHLRLDDGAPLTTPSAVETFASGPVHLMVITGGDDRRWLMGTDQSHPAVTNPPAVDAYPLDARWRVAARFDALEQPRAVRVKDVRGGEAEFKAAGTLAFRLNDQEMRLTAFGEPDVDTFFVMFKDPTNQSTTYQGYRIVSPKVVKNTEWTVIDFNFASNPPCAYSKFTTCPLPPPENRLPVAIEAGLKRLPGVSGYSE